METAGAEEGQPPPQPVATPLGFRLIGGNEGAEGKGPIVYVRNRVGEVPMMTASVSASRPTPAMSAWLHMQLS